MFAPNSIKFLLCTARFLASKRLYFFFREIVKVGDRCSAIVREMALATQIFKFKIQNALFLTSQPNKGTWRKKSETSLSCD